MTNVSVMYAYGINNKQNYSKQVKIWVLSVVCFVFKWVLGAFRPVIDRQQRASREKWRFCVDKAFKLKKQSRCCRFNSAVNIKMISLVSGLMLHKTVTDHLLSMSWITSPVILFLTWSIPSQKQPACPIMKKDDSMTGMTRFSEMRQVGFDGGGGRRLLSKHRQTNNIISTQCNSWNEPGSWNIWSKRWLQTEEEGQELLERYLWMNGEKKLMANKNVTLTAFSAALCNAINRTA